MRFHYVLLPVAVLVFIAGCQTGPSEADKQAEKSIAELNKRLDRLEARLVTLEKKSAKEESPAETYSSLDVGGPKLLLLNKIKYPSSPDRQKIRDYIIRIAEVSQGQNCFSPDDPQVDMLSKVGHDNLDLLIEYSQCYYVGVVLTRMVKPEDKNLILNKLRDKPDLISCVIANDWTKDARKTIFNRLKKSRHTSYDWINAAVNLAEPEDYGILENFFMHGEHSSVIYSALCRLDNFDLHKAVDRTWKYKKKHPAEWGNLPIAKIAAKYGHKDALDYLVKEYRGREDKYISSQLMTKLNQLTGQILPPQKMYKWYNANKDKLVYDKENKIYMIKGNSNNGKSK